MPFPYPLETNNATGEPFLRLDRHPNIVLTPPRLSDASDLIRILNDDRVCSWLSGPPYPYLPEHATAFLTEITAQSAQTIAQLQETPGTSDGILFEYPPVRYIRELQEDGTDIFLGDISFLRTPSQYIPLHLDAQISFDAKTLYAQNITRELGDPDIFWTVGDFLSPSHHGRGIMSDALGTFLRKWGTPRMGIRRMVGTAFAGNIGSVRVMEKSGFVYRETRKDFMIVKGQSTDVVVLDWRLPEDGMEGV